MARASRVLVVVILVLLVAAAVVGGRTLVRQQSTISGLRHSVAQLGTKLAATDARATGTDSHLTAELAKVAQERGQVAAIASLLGSTPVLPDLSSAVAALQTEYRSLASTPAAPPVVVTSGFATVQQLATVEQLTSCLKADMNQIAGLSNGDLNGLLQLPGSLSIC